MKKSLLSYLKHLLITIVIVVPALILFGLSQGASYHYGDDERRMDWNDDGPYVFFDGDDELVINTIHGNMDAGFSVSQRRVERQDSPQAEVYFRLDDSRFPVTLRSDFAPPPVHYDDDQPILAISDIESGYQAFRDFLVVHNVVDAQLNWLFGQGHLVLLGDFVDRGFSTTQVLWLIFHLEQQAAAHGGSVHFILGNHEIKNLQGNFESASPKYFYIAAILGLQQHELYGPNALLGRWLSSRNTIERINNHLFVHGGIHPDLADASIDLAEINAIIRQDYRLPYVPRPDHELRQLLTSTQRGPAWYRGYFKDDLSQSQVDRGLEKFGVEAVVVGHTLQNEINRQFEGKVIAIDVAHPKDYHRNWPTPHSEGLLIEGERYYRLLENGERVAL